MGKLVFDTLKYVKMLTDGGVVYSDVHAESLAEALLHNVYVKNEVDQMIETIIKEFAERTHQIEKETIEMKAEMNRMINRHTVAIITILGGLMALFTFIEHLIR